MSTDYEDIKSDDTVQDIVRLYATLNDWYDNIHQERRGARACEIVTQVRDRGLVPLAQRYFEYVAEENGDEFNGDAEDLLESWEDEFRPDYVEEAEEHDFEDYGVGLTRVMLDPELRFAHFASDAAVEVNKATISVYDEDVLSEELQDEFDDLWSEWYMRLDDLYWRRRNRKYKDIVLEQEKGIHESEQEWWEGRRQERYPELPVGTLVGGEEQW